MFKLQSWIQGLGTIFALFYSILILICLTPKSLQLGLCPEAAKHLQEMKDMLIAVSNDLLDNAAELSQAQIDKLRQDRLCFFSFFFSHDIILPFDAWVFWFNGATKGEPKFIGRIEIEYGRGILGLHGRKCSMIDMTIMLHCLFAFCKTLSAPFLGR